MRLEQMKKPEILENAEHESLRIFPDNPIGASLVKKSLLNEPMTEEEEDTLMEIIQEKQYDSGVLELFKKAKEHNPESSLVEVNKGVIVHIPKEEQRHKIWTYGLGTCNATLTVAEMSDGTREAILTHFFPDKIREHIEKIAELFSTIPVQKIQKSKTFIFAIGENKENKLEIKNKKNTDLLTSMIHSQIPQTEIEVIPYPEFHNRLSGTKNQGVLVANIPGSSQGEATYQTWFNNGKLS